MRKCLHLIALAVLLLCSASYGQTLLEERSTDTLWIDSIVTHSGQEAVLNIYFANADTLNGLDIPLTYKYPDLIVDSVSFVGSRIEDRFLTIVQLHDSLAICHIGAFYFDTTKEDLGPGSGLLASLHVTIPDNYETRLIPVDTTRLQTGLTFAGKDNQTFVPVFKKGYIDNTFAPALSDSVWVEDVDVTPGEQFSVTMYSSNEHPVYNIKIPIEYQSDNLVFDSISVAGTRSFHAAVADAISDDDQKKALISLRFGSEQLLPVGEGPLVMLHFTCLVGGTTADVSLDTTEFEYGKYYFQLGSVFFPVKVYPEFHAGNIKIDQSLDVRDDALAGLPDKYDLSQNYPNPFNPSTSIAFALPERSRVVMDVFNILGQQVRRLVNETLPAGNHSIEFDGHDKDGNELASGVYFYRIKTTQFTQSKKMMLMK